MGAGSLYTEGARMTKEERKEKIEALLRERKGYVVSGKDDRVAQVDAALAELGNSGAPPAKRASKRIEKDGASRG
jgi:hypothetical protein